MAQSFADQLAELLRQADDPYYRLMNGLSQAIAIMQDGQKQAADAAIDHLLSTIRAQTAQHLEETAPALSEQQRLDREFHIARARAGAPH